MRNWVDWFIGQVVSKYFSVWSSSGLQRIWRKKHRGTTCCTAQSTWFFTGWIPIMVWNHISKEIPKVRQRTFLEFLTDFENFPQNVIPHHDGNSFCEELSWFSHRTSIVRKIVCISYSLDVQKIWREERQRQHPLYGPINSDFHTMNYCHCEETHSERNFQSPATVHFLNFWRNSKIPPKYDSSSWQ